MAVYKVPQDVEAEDKLLGPFSMRQFIYLIIAAMGIAIGWALAQVLLPLAPTNGNLPDGDCIVPLY